MIQILSKEQVQEKERENKSGNYGGLFGKITNFKWTFNPDGSYDVVLRIGSLELKEEAMDLATVVLLQQMPGFDPADIIPMEPPTNRTLH